MTDVHFINNNLTLINIAHTSIKGSMNTKEIFSKKALLILTSMALALYFAAVFLGSATKVSSINLSSNFFIFPNPSFQNAQRQMHYISSFDVKSQKERSSHLTFPKISAPITRADLNSEYHESEIFTIPEIQDAARRIGMEISLSTLGPFYRSVIRLANSGNESKGEIIGYTSGSIIAPLLRQDAMKIFAVNTGNRLSRSHDLKSTRGWKSPSTFGLTLLLGAYGARYAYDQGCTKAELLAINDNAKQHEILVRHYKRLGLKPVREVDESISCIAGIDA